MGGDARRQSDGEKSIVVRYFPNHITCEILLVLA